MEPGPPARPTGTVTFLFSDIEGSTVRWERDSTAMERALALHDAVVRAALETRGAYVFKKMGDSFCAAFAMAADAVAAALDVQRALAGADFSAVEGIRARMALHTGRSAERDGDYFGPTLNRVARLLVIGHGGQVLVSNACVEFVREELPPQCALRSLGEHRLKDLAQSEHVYQLLAPDLAADFPALRSLDHLSNNLPAQVSSFVGREAEVAEIAALVGQHRLVTLVGSGGVGKTRLSLYVAADLFEGRSDGVWFIELAPLTKGEYIPSTIAQALEITFAPEGDPVQNLVRALKRKDALLIFDNCEHLVDPAAHVISAILHGAPQVRVLASSRQGLGIAGEATYQVQSLDLTTGVALFVERAQAATATFSLTAENAPIVADICRRLDGIPLAIELAAARVRMLSPHQLRQRLDERFHVLTGGGRDVLPRQQTLRALIDWSHDLLDERERKLFRRLAIFVDGFTLEGAAAVGSDFTPLGMDSVEGFNVLASLVDKSLVLAEPQGDVIRYRLLESTRAYAAEKLAGAGERDLLAGRHMLYLRDRFTKLREMQDRTARRTDLIAELKTDLEEVRSALDGALARSSVIDGAALLADLGVIWEGIGLGTEGIARCEAYLAALPADQSGLRARLAAALSFLVGDSGQKMRSFELAAQAVDHARKSGDDSLIARALLRYVSASTTIHELDEAERALTQAEAIPGISAYLRIELLGTRSRLSMDRGDVETAARTCEQLRQEHRSLGNSDREQTSALNLAEIEYASGQTQRAIAIVRETLPAARANANQSVPANLLSNLSGYLAAANDFSGALAAAREAIRIYAARDRDIALVAVAIEHLALAIALSGDCEPAATLEGYADAAFARYGFLREFNETTTHDRLSELLHERLASDELARLTAKGAALTPEDAVALALNL
jgi:predicted ATPase/class 3 adenylate cyclase